MKARKYDYIIVGFGLAGSTLATHLHWNNKKTLIIDTPRKNISSQVAAGLYNPITGRKMVKTWMADDLFPYLEDYYEKVESRTRDSFLVKNSIYRPFKSVEEQNEWMGKSSDSAYKSYVKKVHKESTSEDVSDEFGGIELQYSGYLDASRYLEASRSYLVKDGSEFLSEDFDHKKLTQKTAQVVYGEYIANRIIFCEGPSVTKNPYFNWLPMRPVKGEILFIRTKPSFDYILNRGIFVIKISDDMYKVGSTYDNYDLTVEPTEKARKDILSKLKGIYKGEFEIVDQIAGIRPATKDRRPIIGWHPKNETIGVFNGLGAKGVSLAPHFARHFVDHMVYNTKLDEAIDVGRYFSLYSETE